MSIKDFVPLWVKQLKSKTNIDVDANALENFMMIDQEWDNINDIDDDFLDILKSDFFDKHYIQKKESAKLYAAFSEIWLFLDHSPQPTPTQFKDSNEILPPVSLKRQNSFPYVRRFNQSIKNMNIEHNSSNYDVRKVFMDYFKTIEPISSGVMDDNDVDDTDSDDEDDSSSLRQFYAENQILAADRINSEDCNKLLSLSLLSYINNSDIGSKLINEYEYSVFNENISFNDFIRRSHFFNEMRRKWNIKHDNLNRNKMYDIIYEYFETYLKYFESPIPKYIPIKSNYKPINDNINTITQYITKTNDCIKRHKLIKTRPIQFDLTFVYPDDNDDSLDNLEFDGMIKSSPGNRYKNNDNTGIQEVYTLMRSSEANLLLNGDINNNKKLLNRRHVLLVVRKTKNETFVNGTIPDATCDDILYLFSLPTKHELTKTEFTNNEILWKLNAKEPIGNISLAEYNPFSVSYHMPSDGVYRIFLGKDNYGSRIYKNDVFDKLAVLINSKYKNEDNIISNHWISAFNLSVGDVINNKLISNNKRIFNLKYECKRLESSDYTKPIIYIDKECTKEGINIIKQTFDQPKNLYYHLNWTCKMQVIDGEAKEYKGSFPNGSGSYNIGIFNVELNELSTGDALYIVSVKNEQPNKPQKWHMIYELNNNSRKYKSGFLTKSEIESIYGIESEDLPSGSRERNSNKVSNMINSFNITNIKTLKHNQWRKLPKIQSQQQKKKIKNKNKRNRNQNQNRMIRAIITDIELNNKLKSFNNNTDKMKLIPIVSFDKKSKGKYSVELLYPIQINASNWIALSFKSNKITSICIDCGDIRNKASLLNPNNNSNKYKWLNNNISELIIKNSNSKSISNGNDEYKSIDMNMNMNSNVPSHILFNNNRHNQLNAALAREQKLKDELNSIRLIQQQLLIKEQQYINTINNTNLVIQKLQNQLKKEQQAKLSFQQTLTRTLSYQQTLFAENQLLKKQLAININNQNISAIAHASHNNNNASYSLNTGINNINNNLMNAIQAIPIPVTLLQQSPVIQQQRNPNHTNNNQYLSNNINIQQHNNNINAQQHWIQPQPQPPPPPQTMSVPIHPHQLLMNYQAYPNR